MNTTIKLNEADLLKMGFTRANVAALRQVINAIGDMPTSTSLSELTAQVNAEIGYRGQIVIEKVNDLELLISFNENINNHNSRITELEKTVADLRNEIDEYGRIRSELAEAVKNIELKANLISPAFTTSIGFNGSAPIGVQNVTGAKGGNVALGSLLPILASYGLITDSSTA